MRMLNAVNPLPTRPIQLKAPEEALDALIGAGML